MELIDLPRGFFYDPIKCWGCQMHWIESTSGSGLEHKSKSKWNSIERPNIHLNTETSAVKGDIKFEFELVTWVFNCNLTCSMLYHY